MIITIFSEDKFLIDYIKHIENTDVFINKINYIEKSNILIFDNIKIEKIQDFIKNLCVDNMLILNISKYNINLDCITNIKIPLKITLLKDKIVKFIEYSNKNMINYSNYIINFNNNCIYNKNIKILLTEKEMELIKFIINNKVTKDELLSNIWNIKNTDNKVVETTIYNIRQKFKSLDLENFIICKNGFYQINKEGKYEN